MVAISGSGGPLLGREPEMGTQDRMIPPPAQHFMAERAGATVTEVAASHAVYVSQPQVVADLIAGAAGSLGTAGDTR